MNVLIIGDEHTYGYGLAKGQLSYVGHFIRQMSQLGRPVTVETYAHLTITQVLSTLTRLPLDRYDLVLLQLDYALTHPALVASLPGLRPGEERSLPLLIHKTVLRGETVQSGMLYRLRTAGSLLISVGLLSLFQSRPIARGLSALLKLLRPHRHKVLLLTPFPHREPVRQWLRKKSRSLLLRKAGNQLFSVFDSSLIIQPREEYFLPEDQGHLSAVSHELLGRALFDFYQSAPTIVTVQAIRRDGDEF